MAKSVKQYSQFTDAEHSETQRGLVTCLSPPSRVNPHNSLLQEEFYQNRRTTLGAGGAAPSPGPLLSSPLLPTLFPP